MTADNVDIVDNADNVDNVDNVDLPRRCLPSPQAGGARSQDPADQGFLMGATNTWISNDLNPNQ